MGKLIDLTGQRFGRLVVIRRATIDISRGRPMWDCHCDCGKDSCVLGASLRSGNTRSCRCLEQEYLKSKHGNRFLPPEITARNGIYSRYKSRAKRKGILFDISVEDFELKTKQRCYYCNAKPTPFARKTHEEYCVPYVGNGLDRVDPTKGYILSNVVPCCSICNSAKSNHPVDKFIKWIHRAHKHLIKGEKKNASSKKIRRESAAPQVPDRGSCLF